MQVHLIIIVEADPIVSFVLTDALLEAGFDAFAVSAADEAICAFELDPTRFRALIMDVNMADGANNWEAARRVRDLRPAIPVIYLTSDSADQWRSKGVPGSVLLQKPFIPVQVMTALDTLINGTDMDGGTH